MAKILLIEDDPMLLELYTDLLKGEGFVVDQASDGDHAWQLAKEGGYDLVLLDVILPKRDGLSILKDLASDPPKIPNKQIILMTNIEQEKTISQAKTFGVAKCLVKSNLTPEQFLEEIKSSLPQ